MLVTRVAALAAIRGALAPRRGHHPWSGTRFEGVLQAALAVVLTIGFALLLVVTFGVGPVETFWALWNGAFGNQFNIGQTIMVTSLLVFTGLAAAIPFSARLFNIGGEGQMVIGAVIAVGLGVTLPADWSPWLLVPIITVLSMVAGATWGVIPGVLKARFDSSEMIISLMLNFVAFAIADYALTQAWPDEASQATTAVPPNARLPRIWEGTLVDIGAVLAFIAILVAFVLMRYTRIGFEIRAIGLNASAARLAGMRVGRVTVFTFALGGAFAALAGVVSVLGLNGRLINGFSGNYGYLGIAVALLARMKPAYIAASALLFGALRVGSNALQAGVGLSGDLGDVLVATFILLILVTGVVRFRPSVAA